MAGAVEKLRKLGHEVHAFNEYHFRVDDVFDFWYPRGKWHDLVTGERGQKPLDQMHFFVHRRLADRPTEVAEQQFVQSLVNIGWNLEEARQAWKDKQSNRVSSPQ